MKLFGRKGKHKSAITRSRNSIDSAPWEHPYLNSQNIGSFRAYSEQVWEFGHEYARRKAEPLDVAFAVNIAQSAYNWARLTEEAGHRPTLYLHPLDNSAISKPEWEDFDGEFANIFDGEGFGRQGLPAPTVPCQLIATDSGELYDQHHAFKEGNRQPLYRVLARNRSLRHECFVAWEGLTPYFSWVCELASHNVICAISAPIAAYLSNRPYLAHSIGGDLQFDCGRNDDYGRAMGLAFNAAEFLTFTNPHTLGHCRRFGFTNGIYLPHPVDDRRYSPGEGKARKEWEGRYGEGVYILSAARIDDSVKGNGNAILNQLMRVARRRPQARFVFLAWGHHADGLKAEVASGGMSKQFLFLTPVGKKRLIDYYRSCDVVLDQFVFGYYGATGLEAAACGKPIIMRIRPEHYHPLYQGDVAPVENVECPKEQLEPALVRMIDNEAYRRAKGAQLREWLVRNHGRARAAPVLLSLLQLAADRVPLPQDLVNPLLGEESQEEAEYHVNCLKAA